MSDEESIRRPRRGEEEDDAGGINLAFIDLLSCGLGGVLLLLLVFATMAKSALDQEVDAPDPQAGPMLQELDVGIEVPPAQPMMVTASWTETPPMPVKLEAWPPVLEHGELVEQPLETIVDNLNWLDRGESHEDMFVLADESPIALGEGRLDGIFRGLFYRSRHGLENQATMFTPNARHAMFELRQESTREHMRAWTFSVRMPRQLSERQVETVHRLLSRWRQLLEMPVVATYETLSLDGVPDRDSRERFPADERQATFANVLEAAQARIDPSNARHWHMGHWLAMRLAAHLEKKVGEIEVPDDPIPAAVYVDEDAEQLVRLRLSGFTPTWFPGATPDDTLREQAALGELLHLLLHAGQAVEKALDAVPDEDDEQAIDLFRAFAAMYQALDMRIAESREVGSRDRVALNWQFHLISMEGAYSLANTFVHLDDQRRTTLGLVLADLFALGQQSGYLTAPSPEDDGDAAVAIRLMVRSPPLFESPANLTTTFSLDVQQREPPDGHLLPGSALIFRIDPEPVQ